MNGLASVFWSAQVKLALFFQPEAGQCRHFVRMPKAEYFSPRSPVLMDPFSPVDREERAEVTPPSGDGTSPLQARL